MTLYLKYRSQTIEDLDLESVRSRLRQLSQSIDKLPHAFLFSGPRGTGKTSAARILAKLVNCEKPVKTKDGYEPCNKCETCKAISAGRSMDVIEMDTASNRGIEDIRGLRESINLSPAHAKKKIYIMDEAHMLTLEAANAFLKTLEEPPAHAIFVLATTDPAKLPATVRSRLAAVDFQKANEKEVSRALSRIIKGESLEVEDGVMELIASRADGSFRDAVKMLESLSLSEGKITLEKAKKLLLTNTLNVEDLLAHVSNKNINEALRIVRAYSEAGGSTRFLIDNLQSLLRQKLLAGPTPETISLIKLLFEARANLARSYSEELPLELALIEWASPAKAVEPASGEGLPPEPPDVKLDKKKALKLDKVAQLDSAVWSKIVSETGSKNITLEALLRSARPVGLDGNTLNIAVYYKFHKERLEAEQYRRMVEEVIGDVLGLTPARLVCVLEDQPKSDTPEIKNSLTEPKELDIIKAAEEIFGE